MLLDAELTQINITSKPFSLHITWNVTAEYCKFIYKIQSSNEMFYNLTTDTFVLFNNLNACEHYEGTVSILYMDETIHSRKFYATTSEAGSPNSINSL